MKIILPLVFLIATLNHLSAQTGAIDSLQKVLLTQKDDTNKVNTLLGLSYEYLIKPDKTDSGLLYAKNGLTLSQKLRYPKGQAESLFFMGINSLSKETTAFEYLQEALDIFRKIGDKEGILKTLNAYSGLYVHRKITERNWN